MSSSAGPRYWAVVAAAGGGTRMGADRPKQYLQVRGRALIGYSLATLDAIPWIDGIVVVLAAGDAEFGHLRVPGKVHVARGGATRADSVLAGLDEVARRSQAAPFVLVHDAARPCVTREEIERLRRDASDEHGGLLALPVADTLKRAESERAAATVNRRELWRAQTPQLFRLDLLRKALQDCAAQGVEVTDEARAMEAAGYRPRLVPGRESNIKVTFPDDLRLAEFWLTREPSA